MVSRRRMLAWLLAALSPLRPARASPAQLQAAMAELFGDRQPQHGRVTVDIPPLVENGNAVPMTVTVDSGAARVARIHVFNEKNPQPHVITVGFGPLAGRAAFSTRIKLADSQKVIAVAEMQDGSLWRGEASVVVTVAACIEEGP